MMIRKPFMTINTLTEQLSKTYPGVKATVQASQHNHAYDKYAVQVQAPQYEAKLSFNILKHAETSDLHDFEIHVKNNANSYVASHIFDISKQIAQYFGGKSMLLHPRSLGKLQHSQPEISQKLAENSAPGKTGLPYVTVR
jgi:hypothetical protein